MNKNISSYSIQELEEEIERRSIKEDRPKVCINHLHSEDPWTHKKIHDIINICENYINSLEEGIEPDEHYIVEETLSFVYGKDVFDWINRCT